MRKSNLIVKYNPYTEDDARRMVQNRIGSPDNAKNDLGFSYKYSLEEGLLKLIDWRKENL